MRGGIAFGLAMFAAGAASAGVTTTGAYSTSVEVEVPHYYGIEPSVTLAYRSDGGNGPVGVGWQLQTSSTIRRMSGTYGAARSDLTDVFFIDGHELVPCGSAPGGAPSCAAGGNYAFRTETFVKVFYDTGANTWTLTARDGTRSTYGAQLGNTASSTTTLSWALSNVIDTHNHRVDYAYFCDGGLECYLQTISYGDGIGCSVTPDQPQGMPIPGGRVRFYWQARPDPITVGIGSTFEVIHYRLRSIDVAGNTRARVFQLGYTQSTVDGASLVKSIDLFGDDAQVSTTGDVTSGTGAPQHKYTAPAMTASPAVSGSWFSPSGAFDALPSAPQALPQVWNAVQISSLGGGTFTVDNDGDGRTDVLQGIMDNQCTTLTLSTRLAGTSTDHVQALPWTASFPARLSPNPDCSNGLFTADLDGDGRTDLVFLMWHYVDPGDLTNQRVTLDAVTVMSNGDGTWAVPSGPQPLNTTIDLSNELESCAFADVNGDGRDDVACIGSDSLGGHYVNTAVSAGDGRMLANASQPLPVDVGAKLRLTTSELNGDGRADVLVVGEHAPDTFQATTDHWNIVTGLSLGSGWYDWEEQDTSEQMLGNVSIAGGDIDGDGHGDLVILYQSSSSLRVTAARNVGTGIARWSLGHQDVLNYHGYVAVGDADGDGASDIMLAAQHPAHDAMTCNVAIPFDHLSIWHARSRHDGTFALPTDMATSCGTESQLPLTNANYQQVLPADTNGDAKLDWFLVANVSGVMTASDIPSDNDNADPRRWQRADLDGDGRADWVYVGYANPGFDVYTAYAQADGSFVARHQTFAPSNLGEGARVDAVRDWFPIDVDADGKSDLVILDDTTGVVITLVSGAGGFTEYKQRHFLPLMPGYHHWRPLDLDGDGRTDLVHVHMASTNGQPAVQLSSLRAFTATAGWVTGNDIDFAGTMFDHTIAAFYPTDFDGDGRGDLVHVEAQWQIGGQTTLIRTLRSRGDGTFTEVTQTTAQPYVDTHQFLPMDVNGDGRIDLARVVGGPGQWPTMYAMLSRGDGNFGGMISLATSAGTQPWEMDARFVPGDLDRDGLTDFYQFVTNSSSSTLYLMWNRGSSFTTQVVGSLSPLTGDLRAFQLGDRDGDGNADLVRVTSSRVDSYAITAPSSRMAQAANGIGGKEQIDYGTSVGKSGNLPAGMIATVVTQTRILDDVTGLTVDTTSYSFDGATYDARYRRLLGYITETTTGARARTTTTNMIDTPCGARPSSFSLSGVVGLPLATVTTTYWPETSNNQPPYLCLTDVTTYQQCEGSTTCRTVADEQFYDFYGNVSRVIERGDVLDSTDDRMIETPVVANTSAYVVSKPAYRNVSGVSGPMWKLVESTLYLYDHNTSYLTAPGPRAELTTLRRWNDQTGGYLETNYSYDGLGNVTTTLAPPTPHAPGGAYESVTYDCAFHRYPVQACNTKFCTTSAWDFRLERETTTTDPNHEATNTTFDPLGRETRVDYADGSYSTVDYPSAATLGTSNQQLHRAHSDDSPNDGVHWTDVYVDGLGRPSHLIPEGAGTVDLTYDAASERVVRRSLPHGALQTPLWIQLDYDAADRGTRVTFPDGRYRVTRYATGSVTHVNELGAMRVGFSDGYGRIAAIEEDQRTCQFNSDSCVVNQRTPTTYGYDVLDRLVWIRDAANHYVRNTYDSLSRRLTHCTPDAGCTADTYYDDGLPATETDAAHNVRTIHYDVIGRPTQRSTAASTGVVTRTVAYTWDLDPVTGAVSGPSRGRLTQIVDGSTTSINRQPKYGPMGRVRLEHDCIDGRCLDLGYQYDHAGRVSRLTYPDANGVLSASSLVVPYTYLDSGWLKSAGTYAAFGYTPDGLPNIVTFGNGASETRTFNANRRWLDEITVAGKGGVLFHELLGHDDSGRVSSATFGSPHGSTSFVYGHDDLGRLVTVSSSISSQNATYRYDLLGNRTMDPVHGTLFHNDPNHVHAISSTSSGASFSYDPKGQLLQSSVLHLTWNEDGNPIQIDDVPMGTHTIYAYDQEGNRVIKRSTAGQITTFGPLLETDNTGSIVRYIEAGGRIIARIDHTGIEFLHRDHLGSVRTTTDGAAFPLGERSYGVWGDQLAMFGASRAPQRFEGMRVDDENGLVHLGARYYDPAFGQMLSPDTVIPDVYTPQTLHTYAFVMNDPASLVDPTGHTSGDGASWESDPDLYRDPAGQQRQPAGEPGYGLNFDPPGPPPPEPPVYSAPPLVDTQQAWLERTAPEQYWNEGVRDEQASLAYADHLVDTYVTPSIKRVAQVVRGGSSFYFYLMWMDPALDAIDEWNGWGSTQLEGSTELALAAVSLNPKRLGKMALNLPNTARKVKSVVLEVRIARAMVKAEDIPDIIDKYNEANRLLREHAAEGIFYKAFESIPYDSRLSRWFLKQWFDLKRGVSSIRVGFSMRGYQIDEYISRFFGGPQMLWNQHPMKSYVNRLLGTYEWQAVRRQGLQQGDILESIKLVFE